MVRYLCPPRRCGDNSSCMLQRHAPRFNTTSTTRRRHGLYARQISICRDRQPQGEYCQPTVVCLRSRKSPSCFMDRARSRIFFTHALCCPRCFRLDARSPQNCLSSSLARRLKFRSAPVMHRSSCTYPVRSKLCVNPARGGSLDGVDIDSRKEHQHRDLQPKHHKPEHVILA